MSKRSRKILALLCAFVMIFTIIPTGTITANADDAGTWLWPVMTSWQMSRGYWSDHTALDILPGAENSTPVLASRAGKVVTVFAGCKNNNGANDGGKGCDVIGCPDTRYFNFNGKNFCNYGVGRGVIIDHGDGFVSQYAHMESVSVSAGQTISKGQQLGYMGSRGASTGKHLHFEIRSGYTSGKSFWSCTPVNNNPYGNEYIINGSWNGIKGIYYSRHTTHSYGSWQTVTSATCTTAGSKKRVCSCGDTQTESIPALGHAWNAGETVTNAGCTEAGVKQYTCTRCSTTKTEALSATGHSPVVDNEVPATCTETGLTKGSHCAKCNAIITAQQVIPPLGHDNHVKSIDRRCDSVTVTYQCNRCNAISNETGNDYVFSEWSETRPANVDESLIESKTQYSYRDKSTTYQDGSSTLEGWTYSGNSENIYGTWNNVGWTKNKPTESDTLRITDTKTVTDKAEYTVYKYYHYYGYADDGTLYNSYGNAYWKNYEETSSTTPFTKEKVYDGYQAYAKSVSGKHGGLWWLSSTNKVPAVTHTEWYYQTRSKTTRYYFEKWSDWSAWNDTVYETTSNRAVRTRTVYRYKITVAGHNWQTAWENDGTNHWHKCTVCGVKKDTAVHIYDNEKDETCNVCGYLRIVHTEPQVDPDAVNLTVESKRVPAGKEVKLTVNLSNNPGLAYLKLLLNYDDTVLELISTSNTQLLTGTYTTSKTLNTKPYVLQWMGADDSTEDGNIVVLTFKVKDEAAAGKYTISLDVAEAYNSEYEDVAIATQNGTITVQNVIIGDLNGDGVVNGKDGILCSQALAGWDVVYSEAAADVNGDGRFNGKDGILLSQYLAGWDVVLG